MGDTLMRYLDETDGLCQSAPVEKTDGKGKKSESVRAPRSKSVRRKKKRSKKAKLAKVQPDGSVASTRNSTQIEAVQKTLQAQFDALRKQEEELAEQQEKNRETLKSVSERQSATEERIKFLEQLDKVHPSQKSSDYVNAEEIRLKVDNDNESDISTFELPGVGTVVLLTEDKPEEQKSSGSEIESKKAQKNDKQNKKKSRSRKKSRKSRKKSKPISAVTMSDKKESKPVEQPNKSYVQDSKPHKKRRSKSKRSRKSRTKPAPAFRRSKSLIAIA